MKFKNRGLLGGAQIGSNNKEKGKEMISTSQDSGGGRKWDGGRGSTGAYEWPNGLDLVAGYGVSNS